MKTIALIATNLGDTNSLKALLGKPAVAPGGGRSP
jgi:hypothetical protein